MSRTDDRADAHRARCGAGLMPGGSCDIVVDGPAGQLRRMVEQLEEDIVLGRRHPRERLIENDLALQFGVNRHVARQALVSLEALGLVVRRPNRGAVVRSFTAAEVVHIYALRELLELGAIEATALPADAAFLDRLTAVQARHDQAAAEDDMRTVFRTNVEFHRVLFSACGNPFLLEAVEHYAQRCHAIRSYSMTNRAYLEAARRDHHAMIEALGRGDRPALAALCRRHIERSKDGYLGECRKRNGGACDDAQ